MLNPPIFVYDHCEDGRDAESPTPGGGIVLPNSPFGQHLASSSGRRESFLYRPESIGGLLDSLATRKQSRASPLPETPEERHGEDLIVTPFAQILAGLRNVRNNFVSLHSLQKAPRKASSVVPVPPPGPAQSVEDQAKVASETLEELDWCLDLLETIQTHRSVSHMASAKFQKMLNRELSQFDTKAANQVSQYIVTTFMDHDVDLPILERVDEDDPGSATASTSNLASPDAPASPKVQSSQMPVRPTKTTCPCLSRSRHNSDDYLQITTTPSSSPRDPSSLAQRLTANISRRIGAGQRRHGSSTGSYSAMQKTVPKYGVHVHKEAEVAEKMGLIDRWGINMFDIHQLTGGHALTSVVYTILNSRGLLDMFHVDRHIMIKYLSRIEEKYRPNPYHNSVHGADVAQSMHVLLSNSQLKALFTDLEVFAAILAAAIHDTDHPGLTNQFLVDTSSELAILYNDDSVLEQHHLAIAFKTMRASGCDILAAFTKKQRQTVRRIMIDMVLATDMSKHMDLLADLKTTVETKKVSGSGVLLLETYTDRIQVLQNMIHLADLSNPTKPIDLYKEWTSRIMEEYWRQGEQEQAKGMEMSPMCDRNSATVEQSQIGFIDYIVHPLWETWADLVYPDAQEMLRNLETNRDWYDHAKPEAVNHADNRRESDEVS